MKSNKKHILNLSVLLLAAVFLLTGCKYDAKASYFNRTILAEYHQNKIRGNDDTFLLTFYEPGTYQVTFTSVPGKSGKGSKYMPQNFEAKIDKAPRVHLISQDVLPDFLRVTIMHDGTAETHDFK